MPSRIDDLIDRRRLRRKVTFWRVITLLVIAAVVVGAARWAAIGSGGDHIARIQIEGTITEDEELLDRLVALRKAERVKGVIITIDSPGGTTVGGEAIFNEVRKLAAAKPVVAQVGGLAASAGYMIASATDYIVARQSSIVGSIGVIVQIPNVSGLMDKIGVQMDEIKSSPLKAEPSPFNQTTDEERQMIRAMVLDSYDWFVGLVEQRRPLSRQEVEALADGSVFTGRQALERKLIDGLGGVDEAKAQLVEQGVLAELEIVEWKPQPTTSSWLIPGIIPGLQQFLALDAEALLRRMGGERLFLDGLLSLWQPKTSVLGD